MCRKSTRWILSAVKKKYNFNIYPNDPKKAVELIFSRIKSTEKSRVCRHAGWPRKHMTHTT